MTSIACRLARGALRLLGQTQGFTDTMEEIGHSTKLSSAGLVYRHFGAEVLANLVASLPGDASASKPDSAVDLVALYKRIYKSFIEHIDGDDCVRQGASAVVPQMFRVEQSEWLGSSDQNLGEHLGGELLGLRVESGVEHGSEVCSGRPTLGWNCLEMARIRTSIGVVVPMCCAGADNRRSEPGRLGLVSSGCVAEIPANDTI